MHPRTIMTASRDDSSDGGDNGRIATMRTPASSITGRIRRMTSHPHRRPPLVTAAAIVLLCSLGHNRPLASDAAEVDVVDPFEYLDGRQEALMRRRLAAWGIDEFEYRETISRQVQEASMMTEDEVLRRMRMTRETPGMAAMESRGEEHVVAHEAGRRQDVDEHEQTSPPTVAIDSRIVGGRDAPAGAFPQLCALYSGSSFMCGGTLIAKNICLTAAHCSFVCDNARVNIYDKTDRGDPVESFEIVDKVDCPKYGVGKVGNACDMCVMKLSGSSSVTPMPMNALPAVPSDNQEVTAIGWGATSEGGRTSDKLQMVEVYAMENDECKTYYGSSRITSDMLCAGVDEGGKDACQGDSGGPLVVMDNDGRPTLIGVVSWGKGCARAGSPGVYGRISHELQWIRETACKLGATELCGEQSPVPPPAPAPTPPSRPELPGSGGGGIAGFPGRPQTAGATTSVGQPSPDRPPITIPQNPPSAPSTPASQSSQNIWWADTSGGGGGDGNPLTQSAPVPTPPTTPAADSTPQTTPQGVGITCKDPNSGITMYVASGSCTDGWEPVTHSITSQPEDAPPKEQQGGGGTTEDLSDNQMPMVSVVPGAGGSGATTTSTTPTTTTTTTATIVTLGTDADPVAFGNCTGAWNYLKENDDWTCQDMIFRGGMGNKRNCAWVAEECDLRCIEDRFKYCCPATAGLCANVPDGACANASSSPETATERGIDAGGIADRGIDAGGGRMSGVTRGSAKNTFSVAGTGDRIGDAASSRSGADDDGYDPDERNRHRHQRRERRRGTRLLR